MNNWNYKSIDAVIDSMVYLRKGQISNLAQSPILQGFAMNEIRLLENRANLVKGFHSLFNENNISKAIFHWMGIRK